MPRHNKKHRPMMRCGSCNGRVATAYAKTHIDRCQRARARRKAARHTKYNKGA